MCCRSSDKALEGPGSAAGSAGANSPPHAASVPFAASEDGGAAEHMLLVALETLYKDASETDVQLGILRVVLQILQRHGACPHALALATHPCGCTAQARST